MSDWPLLMTAAALLLAAAAKAAVDGGLDIVSGCLMVLGAACLGAWLRDRD